MRPTILLLWQAMLQTVMLHRERRGVSPMVGLLYHRLSQLRIEEDKKEVQYGHCNILYHSRRS